MGMVAEINRADVVREVRAAFEAYNQAIERGENEVLNGFFWQSPLTTRFGPAEHLFGYEAIATFRTGSWKPGPPRSIEHLVITSLGSDTASTMAVLIGIDGARTRQSQVWGRMAEGWRIVAAHVSPLPERG
jgi:hypothetical protein